MKDDASTGENEERKRPGVERVYRNDRIAVAWEPKLCIHAGNCFRGLPEVFEPQSRPWILVDAGPADEVAEVVMTCPLGALHFERLDGGPQEPQPKYFQYKTFVLRLVSNLQYREICHKNKSCACS